MSSKGSAADIRCPFCLTMNRVDVARAAERPACGECSRPLLLDRPVKVAAEDFRRTVLEAEVPVLVDFHADWCGPCRVIAPVLDEIAREESGRLLVAKVDSDRAREIVREYGIRGIPTLIRFEGGEEVGRVVGVDTDALRELAGSSAAMS